MTQHRAGRALRDSRGAPGGGAGGKRGWKLQGRFGLGHAHIVQPRRAGAKRGPFRALGPNQASLRDGKRP
jgi:hypothetical protein